VSAVVLNVDDNSNTVHPPRIMQTATGVRRAWVAAVSKRLLRMPFEPRRAASRPTHINKRPPSPPLSSPPHRWFCWWGSGRRINRAFRNPFNFPCQPRRCIREIFSRERAGSPYVFVFLNEFVVPLGARGRNVWARGKQRGLSQSRRAPLGSPFRRTFFNTAPKYNCADGLQRNVFFGAENPRPPKVHMLFSIYRLDVAIERCHAVAAT